MNKDEALKLALEALESCDAAHITDGGRQWYDEKLVDKAITAIKEALAQPEPNYKKALEMWLDKTEWVQETVKPHELGMHRADVLKQRIEATLAQPEHGWTPERIAGMARLKEAQDKKLAQPEQEPVVCDCDSPSWCKQYKKCNRKMLGFMPYVAQPQRTWVGLTLDERIELAQDVDWAIGAYCEYAEKIETKLKAKNETN